LFPSCGGAGGRRTDGGACADKERAAAGALRGIGAEVGGGRYPDGCAPQGRHAAAVAASLIALEEPPQGHDGGAVGQHPPAVLRGPACFVGMDQGGAGWRVNGTGRPLLSS
jgi:hypothetical protein